MINKFIKGLKLGELYYKECVKNILDEHFPNLKYSAAIIGWGSDVLGFDTPISTDHNWGPRLQIFLMPKDYEELKDKISETLGNNLPYEFYGYSTNYEGCLLKSITAGPVNHFIQFYTIKSFFEMYLGFDPYKEITTLDWLTFQEHKLLGVTSGQVYHDGLGELNKIRSKFIYYPKDLWLYLMASQWVKVAQERAFMGRCGDVGDELGSHIVASRLVRELMKLCFLIEKKYPPYTKWFGSSFSQLQCSSKLNPLLLKVMQSGNWMDREKYLNEVYIYVAEMHNALNVTEFINPQVSNYNGRPYIVIDADKYVEAILNVIEDEKIRNIKAIIGSVNQFVDSTDVLCSPELCEKLKRIYN
jgi:hypothetical protein